MSQHTITAVAPEVRDWQSQQGGPMKSYKVHLRNEAGELIPSVEWSRKAGSPAPEKGQTIDCTLEDGKFGKKLKLVPSGGGFGGGGRRGSDPGERKSIEAQVCIKGGVALLTALIEAGLVKPASALEAATEARLVAASLSEELKGMTS